MKQAFLQGITRRHSHCAKDFETPLLCSGDSLSHRRSKSDKKLRKIPSRLGAPNFELGVDSSFSGGLIKSRSAIFTVSGPFQNNEFEPDDEGAITSNNSPTEMDHNEDENALSFEVGKDDREGRKCSLPVPEISVTVY